MIKSYLLGAKTDPDEWNKLQRKKRYQTVNDHLRDYALLRLGIMPDWFESVVESWKETFGDEG